VPLFYNENITPEMTNRLAARAWFSMNVSQYDTTGMDGQEGSQWRMFGEGVDTLDQMVEILQSGTMAPGALFHDVWPKIELDYGGVGEDLQQVGVDNVLALKSAYCTIYGTVNRPREYVPAFNRLY
jgi:hypothetical protein